MPRPNNKRKVLKDTSLDETILAGPKKIRSRGTKAIQAANPGTDTVRGSVRTRSSTKNPSLKSSLKAESSPVLIDSKSSKGTLYPSSKVLEQPEEEVDTEEGESIEKLAANAIKMARNAQQERLQRGLPAFQEELVPTGTDLDNEKMYKEVLLETSELMETRKRAETAVAELKEARLANSRLENKVDTLETQVKRSEEQVEVLQRDLAFVRGEKAEMEKLLRGMTAKETPEASKAAAT